MTTVKPQVAATSNATMIQTTDVPSAALPPSASVALH
jgi:hypothetical protein